ncbi:hypothetical protein C5B96_08975 [Subtercola sp. Z020]|uniref:hypothetical protein n=1 Tax=Subtercola sp. Z020 TaxID=2080582 RepID=UPI000CE816D5|nr:hypothetical protein [Subtercola sp. Z020]PPF82422.1 hypothetical protein C5B96_08975 [Subtercola sp. Z020]
MSKYSSATTSPSGSPRAARHLRKATLVGGGLTGLFLLAACSPSAASSDGIASQNAAALSATRAGSVTGTITSSDPADPIAAGGVAAVLYDATADTQLYTAPVDGSGSYALTGVAPGTYTLFFSGGGQHADEWFDNLPTSAGAKPVVVSSGKAKSIPDVELLATPMAPTHPVGTGSISGAVFGVARPGEEDLGMLPDVEVRAFGSGELPYSTQTDQDGRFVLGGLPDGEYKLHFIPPADSFELVDEWYSDKPNEAYSQSVLVAGGRDSSVKWTDLRADPNHHLYDSIDTFSVKGDVRVGATVSGEVGKIVPAPYVVSYQWTRDDGKSLTAIGPDGRYTIAPDDLGHKIFWSYDVYTPGFVRLTQKIEVGTVVR